MVILYMIQAEYITPYLVTLAVSLVLVFLAIKRHRLTRLLFILIFLLAGLFNIVTVLTAPETYHIYAEMALLAFYRDFIHGYFSQHTREIVVAIGLGQIVVAALLSGGGKLLNLGVVGGVIFFVAIAPLGVGSAFPATLILAVALILMQYRID
jgi:hypothetical protein